MQDAGKPTQDGEEDVDDEVEAAARPDEDGEGRDEERDEAEDEAALEGFG